MEILIWGIGIIVFFGILYLIGKTGQTVRRGIILNKELIKAQVEATQKGLVVNEKWFLLKRKSKLLIMMPLLGLSIVYIVLFVTFPSNYFFASLFGLIPFGLGFFGILIVPGID